VQESSPSGRQGTKGDSARRRPLTVDRIVEIAIRIADAEGLDAVSIRRIAAELDARPMSLYDHISNKGDLLSRMGDVVVAEVLIEQPVPEDWREALTKIARRLYATLVGHAWLPFILPTRSRLGPSGTRQAEQLVLAMAPLDLEPSEIWTVAGTLNDYVLGHSLRIAVAPKGIDLEEAIPGNALAETAELAALPEWLRTRASVERFEVGLGIVLDGIEQRVIARE
jgi:AcrR family transcriptional regulator